jgi:TonB family protein
MKSATALPVAVLLVAMLAKPAGVCGDDSTSEQPALPRIESTGSLEVYPPAALRDGIEGRVLIGFDITPAGLTKNVALIWGENGILNAMAVRVVTNYHFVVPADWQSAGALQRWWLGFVYCIPPSGQSDEFAVVLGGKVYVRGARLPGTPVRNKPDPNASSVCMKQPDSASPKS